MAGKLVVAEEQSADFVQMVRSFGVPRRGTPNPRSPIESNRIRRRRSARNEPGSLDFARDDTNQET
ncbi:MAG TPA: hypothetical protein VHB25_09975 [Gemmatimonadaceae bacterium]|nr:hypothetical protein [Gemmatimonadaceae bacterium]